LVAGALLAGARLAGNLTPAAFAASFFTCALEGNASWPHWSGVDWLARLLLLWQA
jgi:hypothetical protein